MTFTKCHIEYIKGDITMRKRVGVMLACVVLCALCACSNKESQKKGEDNTQDDKLEENVQADVEVNTSEEVVLVEDFNIETIQGRIDEYRSYYTFDAFFVDGILYEYDEANTDENMYTCWNIGEYKSIISYNENVCVVENLDSTVTAYVALSKNNHVCETQKIVLPITADQFILCEAESEENWISLTYSKEGQFYYWVTQLTGEVLGSGNITSIMDQEDAAFGVTKLINTTACTERDHEFLFALNAENELRTFEVRVTAINDTYYIDCYLNDENFGELQDVDKWVELSLSCNLIASKSGDDDNLHFYEGNLIDEDLEFVCKIQLPEGQKTGNIAQSYRGFDWNLIEFDNGDYYKLYYNNVFSSSRDENVLPIWYKMEGLSNLATDYKQICTYRIGIGMLTEDGYFYRLANDQREN